MNQSEGTTPVETGQVRQPRASARVLAAVAAYERTLFLTRRAAADRAARIPTQGDEPVDATRIA